MVPADFDPFQFVFRYVVVVALNIDHSVSTSRVKVAANGGVIAYQAYVGDVVIENVVDHAVVAAVRQYAQAATANGHITDSYMVAMQSDAAMDREACPIKNHVAALDVYACVV
jgi:hypothetical protein